MFKNVTNICFLCKRVLYSFTQEPEGKTKKVVRKDPPLVKTGKETWGFGPFFYLT